MPMQPGDHRERLAKFVSELAHNADMLLRLGAASIRDLRMRTTGLSAKTLNSLTERYRHLRVKTIRKTSTESRPHERVVDLAQVICSMSCGGSPF